MVSVSIVIPCYNAAATLPATIASLQAQDMTDWEAICIDDGSTDATVELLQSFAANDTRIRVVANPGDGPSDARNYGALTAANADYIAFCDADDIWHPAKLRLSLDALERLGCDAVYAKIGFFLNSPEDAQTQSTVPVEPLSIAMLLGENPVCTMSNVVVNKVTFRRTGGFDPRIVHNEDLEWLIRLVGEGASVQGMDTLLVWYRNSPNGLSADLAAMRRGRDAALITALRYGVTPEPSNEAVHFRYLARRALRLDLAGPLALRLSLNGLRAAPMAFLFPIRRGVPTLIGSALRPILPRSLRHALFAR